MKAIRFTLVLAALASMLLQPACSGNSSPPATSAEPAVQAAPSEQAKKTEAVKAEDLNNSERLDMLGRLEKFDPPIDMSWAVTTSAVQQFKNGDTYENNIWSRKYLEELGINLTVAFSADGTSGAYNDKLNLQLASGDLPDIIHAYQYSLFKQAYEAGYVADITDVFAEYASDYLLDCQVRYPGSFEYTSFDGRLHGISFFNDNRAGGILLWIRDDWLENLNKEAPTTMDELYELARSFTYDDPDLDGADDTYGLGLSKDLLSDYCTIYGVFDAYGAPADANDGFYYRGSDGRITNSYLEPGVKDGLLFLNKLYSEGIIDPEFTVKDGNVLQEDIAAGKIGMAFGRQWGTWLPWNLVLEADDVVSHAYPIPSAQGFDVKVGIGNNAGGEIFFVNSKSAHPEAFVMMCNVFSSVYNMWMTPEVSSIYADDEQYRFSPVVLTEPQEPVWGPIIVEALRTGNADDLPARLLNHYTKVKAFNDGTLRDSEAYGLWGQYNIGGSVAICLDDYDANGKLVQNIIGANLPESQVEYQSILTDLEKQIFTEVILTGDASKVDDFWKSWLGAGGQSIIDELETLYPAGS
ncbi:MAG: extracellular solute-binding protein [Clostridiales bacterium]|nr:extracellular solute-binding protein [Clostridiales bacterium]